MSALGSGEEKDVESLEDSESVPERGPQKSVDAYLFAADQRGGYVLPNQVQGGTGAKRHSEETFS